MRYRRFGRSDLEVSEVGFGVWTLASDWWGRIDDPRGMLHAALDAGITFIDTAPVYGDDGVGETLLADVLKVNRGEIILTTKCGYDIDSPSPGEPVGTTSGLAARVGPIATRSVAPPAGHRLHRPLPAPQRVARPDPRRRALGRARQVQGRGQGSRARVALGPAIGWVEEGLDSLRERPIVSLQTVFNVLEQEPGLTFAAEPTVAEGKVGLISRVPHASDTLSGKITRETEFPAGDHRAHRNRENMLDNFDKAETLAFLWVDTGRTVGQAAIAGILANPAFTTVLPTCVSIEDVQEYAARVRPSAHRRRARTARRALARQLRCHQPLRDADEVECRRVTTTRRSAPVRLAPDERRRQLLDVACVEFAERGFYATSMDDLAHAAESRSPSSTNTSRRNARSSSRCWKTWAGDCSRCSLKRPAASRPGAHASNRASPVLPLRRG